MRDLRNENAILQRRIIELEADNNFLKGELKGVGFRRRESTTDKINLAMERRMYWLRIYAEKILIPSLAQVHTIIILAILYLAFGGKVP